MTGQLARIYSETLTAQVGMQTLSDALGRGRPPSAMWNGVEEALEAALDGFRVLRHQELRNRPKTGPRRGSPGPPPRRKAFCLP